MSMPTAGTLDLPLSDGRREGVGRGARKGMVTISRH
jgi:hypothetical protein